MSIIQHCLGLFGYAWSEQPASPAKAPPRFNDLRNPMMASRRNSTESAGRKMRFDDILPAANQTGPLESDHRSL